jgi:hypothetical protein
MASASERIAAAEVTLLFRSRLHPNTASPRKESIHSIIAPSSIPVRLRFISVALKTIWNSFDSSCGASFSLHAGFSRRLRGGRQAMCG